MLGMRIAAGTDVTSDSTTQSLGADSYRPPLQRLGA